MIFTLNIKNGNKKIDRRGSIFVEYPKVELEKSRKTMVVNNF